MHINAAKLSSLQLLRAIAVLLVVHCHVLDIHPDNSSIGHSFQHHFYYLENFGAVGVDIFFVISGFIITVISNRYIHKGGALYFFMKRVIRVVPLYWLVSILLFVFSFMQGNQGRFDAVTIVETTFMLRFPILRQGWTLSFEFIFYAAMAVSMAAGKKKHIYITILFFLSAVSLNYAIPHHNKFIWLPGNGIMLEFLLGAAIGLIYLSPVSINVFFVNAAIGAGVAGLLTTLFTGYGKISEAGFTYDGSLSLQRVLYWGLPSALLVAGLALKEKIREVSVPSFWMAIGNASYSIYLTHVFLLARLYEYWLHAGLLKKVQPDLMIITSVAIVTLAGYFFNRLAELPLLRKLQNWIAAPKQLPPLPVA